MMTTPNKGNDMADFRSWQSQTLIKFAEDATIYMRQQAAEIDRLRAAIEKTIEDNGHLADGDNCTLIDLVRTLEPPTITACPALPADESPALRLDPHHGAVRLALAELTGSVAALAKAINDAGGYQVFDQAKADPIHRAMAAMTEAYYTALAVPQVSAPITQPITEEGSPACI